MMFDLIDEIGSLAKRSMELELELKLGEAKVTLTATSDTKYFQNGKSPSQTFIDSSWKITGFDGELIPLREELIGCEWKMEVAKGRLDLLKKMIEIWRTQSANERLTVV